MSNFNEIKPYTYHLYNKVTQQHYYGVRYNNIAKGWTPDEDLWVKYFSSSKKVKELITIYGKDSFEYEVRKTFETKKEACDYEDKVLRRLHVQTNEKWLNEAIAGHVEMTEERRKLVSIGNKKKWESSSFREKYTEIRCKYNYVFKYLDDAPINIKSITQFCKDYDLDRATIIRVVNGEAYYHKGWVGYKVGYEYLRNEVEIKYKKSGRKDLFKKEQIGESHYMHTHKMSEETRDKISAGLEKFNYTLFKDGVSYKTRNLNRFCRINGLSTAVMLNVVHGRSYSCQGWTGVIDGQESVRFEIEKREFYKTQRRYICKYADNTIKIYDSIQNIASDYNSVVKSIESAMYNRIPHKKMRIYRIIGTDACIKPSVTVINT